MEHAPVGYVNVVTRRCGADGCEKIPSFGKLGDRPVFCKAHIPAGEGEEYVLLRKRTRPDQHEKEEGCKKVSIDSFVLK